MTGYLRVSCGTLRVDVSRGMLIRCTWVGKENVSETGVTEFLDCHFADNADRELMETALRQFEAYFNGKLRKFELPLFASGTKFCRKVWETLREIPYGETATYGELARLVGCHLGHRAVAQACSKNPIVVIIPCHRIIASGGKLGGYSAYGKDSGGSTQSGLEIKRFLLNLERKTGVINW